MSLVDECRTFRKDFPASKIEDYCTKNDIINKKRLYVKSSIIDNIKSLPPLLKITIDVVYENDIGDVI